MEEAKVFRFVLAFPILEARLQKTKGSHDICLDEGLWFDDGAIYMRLSGEMYNSVDGLLGKEPIQEGAVLDCSMDESMSCCRVWGKVLKIYKIASVGQSIKVDNTPAGPLVKDVADKICPNKTGTAGD
jgi:hypothetical protein